MSVVVLGEISRSSTAEDRLIGKEGVVLPRPISWAIDDRGQ
jgi:hypothetical protein